MLLWKFDSLQWKSTLFLCSYLVLVLSRASPSEFVIPLAKYYKAVCSNQISLGMRFRMMFETEESGTRRYCIPPFDVYVSSDLLEYLAYKISFLVSCRVQILELNYHASCRYMGTITGISDLDQVRWKNSQWRNLQVISRNTHHFPE